MNRYTLADLAELETDKVKGSRFIGYARPCSTVAEASAWADELRAGHPGACHVCWAHRGAHPDHIRYVDDGEPSGTAGKPILTVIEGRELESVAVAVVRYFGGTKLGTGGLARAYSAAARLVLAEATVQTLRRRALVSIRTAYSFESSLSYLLQHHHAEILERTYDTEVSVRALLLSEDADALCDTVVERTAGRAHIERGPDEWR